MANDRIILLCRCGHGQTIHKYYPSFPHGEETHQERFIDKHLRTCHPRPYAGCLGGYTPFTLVTEDIFRECAEVHEVEDGKSVVRLFNTGEFRDNIDEK